MTTANDTDAVFQALANRSRRRMLDVVSDCPGISVGGLAKKFDVSRIAVMKHLAVLEAADLLVSEKHGRTRQLYFNAIPLQLIYERWTDEYSAYWSGRVSDIKRRAERRARSDKKSSQGEK